MPVNKSQGDGYVTCPSGFFVALHIEEVPVASGKSADLLVFHL